jgi:tetratricopeptide (TPR) repeat protein
MPSFTFTPPPLTERRKFIYVCVALVALVVALYSHVFHCEFIDFDDNTHIFANPVVRGGFQPEAVAWSFSHFIASQWIPLTWVSHMIDVSLFQMDAGWHHLVNLAFHALNACLVLQAMRRLTGQFWPSVVVATLFAVHPVNVESVAWVAERKNVLSTTFWLLAMSAYGRHLLQPKERWMWLVATFMALGLMAKPMLVTLPCALLLLDVWPLRRNETTPWWKLVAEKVPLFALSAAASAWTLAAAKSTGVMTEGGSLGLAGRLANALIVYPRYLGNLLWPTDLAVLYPIEARFSIVEVASSAMVLIALTLAAWVLRKRAPYVLCGWLWFLGVLVPVTSVCQVGSQAMADRFSYIPQLGIFWAIVWALRELPRPALRWAPLGAAAAVVALSLCTLRQVGFWTDTATLFEHTVSVTRENAVGHAIAGMGYAKREEYPRAIDHYREAARLMPRNAEVCWLLGESLNRHGQTEEAIAQFRRAVALDPKDNHARRNLVAILAQNGRVGEAAEFLPR